MRVAPTGVFQIGLCALVLIAFGCDASTSTTPDEVIVTPAPSATAQRNGNDGPSTPQSGAACEDFGSLSATALTGTLDTSSGRETLVFSIDKRPSLTKVHVAVIGGSDGETTLLGSGVNASALDCTHCLMIAVGCTAASCDNAAWFFPRVGSVILSSVAKTKGQSFSGKFSGLELEQVTINRQERTVTPTPGGACIRIPELGFASIVNDSGEPPGPTPNPPADDGGGPPPATDGGAASGDSGGGQASQGNDAGGPSTGIDASVTVEDDAGGGKQPGSTNVTKGIMDLL